MDSYDMDLVKTPDYSFAMIDIKRHESDSAFINLFPRGETAFCTTNVSGSILDHIFGLLPRYADAKIGGFRDFDTGLQVPSGDLGELLSEDMLYKLATEYAVKEAALANIVSNTDDLKTTPDAAYEYVKSRVVCSVWTQLIKQQGGNFLTYNKEFLAAIRYQDNELRLADAIGMNNNGHGDFEILVFETPSRLQTDGEIYPVETLKLQLKDKIVGQGVYDFDQKF